MKADKHWQHIFQERFAGRENIGKVTLYERYFKHLGLPQTDVFECFDLIAEEYEIPIGVLRPEDSVQILFEPVPPMSPWQWLMYQVREGDSQSEISYEIYKRMHKHGTLGSWPKIETIEDLVCAWCGQKPKL